MQCSTQLLSEAGWLIQYTNQKARIEKKLADVKQEAPHAYKGIGPIVDTLTRAGIARPVAELVPLMTIKG